MRIKHITTKEWLLLGACFAVIIFVFCAGILDKQQTWGTMEWTYMDFIKQDKENPHYGIQNTGPTFNLPAGKYKLKFNIETDGDGFVRLSTTNDAPVEPNAFPFSEEQVEQIVEFDVLESAKQMDIQIDFESGTYFKMGETRLYTPFYKDNAFTLAGIILAMWLLFVLEHHGKLSIEIKRAIVFLTIAVLFASAPALKENLSVFHDTRYHSARLRNLAEGLSHWQFPVRLGGFSYNGYGAITSVFYPDFFLYPFAFMLLCGASLQYVMNLLLVFGNGLAAFSMYYSAKRIWKDDQCALISSILYVLSVYHVTDGSVRYALGELLAMGFLPLFMAGLWEAVYGNAKQWKLLAVGASAIFMSHVLSTFLCAILAVLFCLLSAPKIIREKRIIPIAKALICALCLCAFQITPLLTYSRQGIGVDASLFTTTMAGTAMAPAQLFLEGSGNLSRIPKDTTLAFMPLEWGLPLWIGFALILIRAAEQRICNWDTDLKTAMLFVLISSVFTWMSTTLFPWSYVSVVTKLFDRVQFAYRYLMFPALLLSLAGGWGISNAARTNKENLLIPVFTLIICVITILPTITAQTRISDMYEFGKDVSPDIRQFTEYCIPNVDMKITNTRRLETEGEIAVSNYEKKGSSITAHVTAKEKAVLVAPLFGFTGYRAILDQKKLETDTGKDGRLCIEIPENSDGELTVRFVGLPIWRVGDVASLAAWIWMFLTYKKRDCELSINHV